ncbi:hypothetical protein RZ70_03100 [Apilactobacillus kunkeei]|uniref:GIY-YIG nuclease family protein n=1 Tax=Apilactobacillus kunkeei TaxID=148814 RepID=UPI0006BF1AD5|nr:GIY-YIG nuclease family protein [Apilactobacillus kunkeei]KOY73695.1 hypothetical protein RZ70_03100 [Apilactobacillus kunkeei]
MCTNFYIYKIRLDPTPNEDGTVPNANPIYYIGETKNIKKRLTYHIHGSNNSSNVIIKHLHPDDDNHPEYYVSSVEAIYRFSNYDFKAGDSFICNIENYFYSLERILNEKDNDNENKKANEKAKIWGAYNTQTRSYMENDDNGFKTKAETARGTTLGNFLNDTSITDTNENDNQDVKININKIQENYSTDEFADLFDENLITVTNVLNRKLKLCKKYKETEKSKKLSDFLISKLR